MFHTGPCLSSGITDCSKDCSSSLPCIPADNKNTDGPCYCDALCYSIGGCCSDAFHVQNCLGESKIIMTLYSVPIVLTFLHSSTVPETSCDTGEVRLAGGEANSYSGRVEVCVNGVWGTICNFLQDWGPDNAAVVCGQLGFPTISKSVCLHGC